MSKSLVIETVKDQGQAAELGFQQGDILKDYDGNPIQTNRDLSVCVGKAKSQGKENVTLTLLRNDEPIEIELTTSAPLGLVCTEEDVKPKKRVKPLPQEVVVTDINMSFISMVFFMVKWSLASIPAIAIVMFIYGILAAMIL
ncbi:PDZ domain-containing protein [Neptuniibacter sp.]|uniref:PDZ domain-containing protein n=1 Tax=Neptuniibacter sp. TaxID=1962643 RepID=UPI002612B712|nr:PDZ domain-containing protein [Neptuniibacter sp.]MCP4595740.1 PDZ domain-containing protein [Neptuniibacter sp.]